MSAEPSPAQRRPFFQRHPILRDALCWAIPALLIGALLRILFTAYLPYAFWGADSRSFYQFAHKLFQNGSLSLGEKRRYLYPILMVPITLLPGAPLRWLAFFQHTFGLLTLLPLAYAIRKSLSLWRLWIVPITVVYAGLPIILWDEHELLGDHLFFALLVWTFGGWIAWVTQEHLARSRRMFWVFFVPFTLFILTKPSGRFVWPGMIIAFLMIKAWRVLNWKQYLALFLLIVVTLTVGSRRQGAWLFYNSVFPLTQLDTPLHAEYKAEIRDMVEHYRRDIDIYHVLEDKEPFYFLRDPEDQENKPHWKALGSDERLKNKIYLDLAIEGVKARPDLFLYIGLQRVVFDANVSAYGVGHYADGQFTERTKEFYDEAEKDERSPIRLAFALPKKGPVPPYETFQHTIEPAPGSWPARFVRAWVGAYGQKLDFLRYPTVKEQYKVPLVKVTWLGWWFFAALLLSFLPAYWRTLGTWALISVGYVFGVYLISVDNVHYIAPAWSIFFVLLAVPADALLRKVFPGPSKASTPAASRMTSPSHSPSVEAPPPRKRLLPWLWPLLLAVIYLTLNTVILLRTVKNPQLAEKMQAKDSRQYIEIATQFASGDFSMAYVKEMPHRQPLYPLCLAPVIHIWGQDLVKEGYVNVIVGLIGLFCVYYGIRKLFDSTILAVVISLAYTANAFMLDKTACRLMTEALHIVAVIVLILLYLGYLKHGKTAYLAGAAAAAGMDYLARTNGLFVMAAMVFTLGIHDLWRLLRKPPAESKGFVSRLGRVAMKYIIAGVVFAIVTTPTWVPRYIYFRSPFYHGYLSNFMWVDTYDQAHTGQIKSDFTWKDYAKTHDLSGFVQRWTHGFYHVYYDVPRHTEHVRYLYLFFVIGVITAFVKRRWDYALLFLFLFIQELPVVWTIIANPGPRIPYGNLFPFELFFTALAFSYLCSLTCTRLISRRANSSSEAAAA